MDILALEPDTIANPAEVSDADAEARLSADRRQGSQVRRAREARSAADPVSRTRPTPPRPRPRSRRARASTTSSRSAGLKPEDTDIGETTKDAMLDKGEADRRLRPAARGRERRAQEPVRSGHRPRQKHHAVDDQALSRRSRSEVKRQVSASRAGDKIQALHDKIEDLQGVRQDASSRPPRRWA